MTLCSVPVCDRVLAARGLCLPHYKRWRNGKPIDQPIRSLRTCSVEGCDVEVRSAMRLPFCKSHRARVRSGNTAPSAPGLICPQPCSFLGCDSRSRSFGLCVGHYQQRREGRDLTPLRRATGRLVTPQGYVQLFRPDLGWTRSGWVMEHRVVMSEVLGRPLAAAEQPHHINGDRADNRPANLELWSSSQPSGQRVADKVEWAKELLTLYEPSALR